ncbi:MAG: hypothetical protein UT39_C0026G0006 [Candidatus Woesebacteria bacterium GW2011_GWA1_39_21]|uniref:Uncharacterized protein n=1 Tax=Candidatus Woesebacteria bacterium GW2011_GWA1_39_21 TaxID=1618550 RepID=A0A0G0NAN9_9BACT|nr:MAG: hypothetical protein UT39_C0026G0006 [Candidatus Woesebacteria bacterium GW2011_GWA1_39_21]
MFLEKIKLNLITHLKFIFIFLFFLLLLPKNTSAQTCSCSTGGSGECVVIDRCGGDYTENCSGPLCSACNCVSFPTNTPLPLMWVCRWPGAVYQVYGVYSKCEPVRIDCPNPDVVGGACFTTEQRCIDGCILVTPGPINILPTIEPLCTYAPGRYGVNSAIGCVPIDDTNQLLTFILRWALGVGGGISFLLIVTSGFMILASGANPERVKAGKQLITAAITGLILIIFSVFILDFIGIRVLRLPGL